MTGFGTAHRIWETGDGVFAVEVEARSVNGRHLEVRVRQPWGAAVEQTVRQLAEARCGRGRIDVTISLRAAGAQTAAELTGLASVGIDAARLRGVVRALRDVHALALEEGLELRPSNALDLLKFAAPQARAVGEAGSPAPPGFTAAVVGEALDGLAAFRTTEGDALTVVLGEHLTALRVEVDRIAQLVEDQVHSYAQRLHRRVRELCEGARVQGPDETRLAQEVALVAARADVAEELARLRMHLDRMRDVLAGPPAPGQGRTLEFVAQELLREFTTIGSKIVSHEAASIVIDAKGALERIREQVSNVE